jgi:transcriptional regulator with XRE-family HTH domain
MTAALPPIGTLLREWRQRRRLSQLDLACEAEISARHLSFLETGRSAPSREMVLRLAEKMGIPIRERNALLLAAGFAPAYPEKSLTDPALDSVRLAIDLMLAAQKPYPAFAIDRHWSIVASNAALPELYVGVAPFLLDAPVNALRLTLHPEGLAPRIANLGEWRGHLLSRLGRQIEATWDPTLLALIRELSEYPGAAGQQDSHGHEVALPLKIHVADHLLSFFSMTTVFGTPVDVMLSELMLEFFVPADAATAATIRAMEGV